MKKIFLIICCFLSCADLFSQVTPYSYSVQAAASSELVYCANQDHYGRLLIGTDKGMYRYNGFKSVRVPAIGNYSRDISTICCSGRNVFAANQAGQVLQMINDKLRAIDLKDMSGDVRKLEVKNNVLTVIGSKFMTSYQLPDFRFIEQISIPFTEDPSTDANCVTEFRNKHYAVLNSNELVEIEDQSSRNIPSSTGKFIIEFDNQLVILPNYVANEPIQTFLDGRFRSWGSLMPRSTSRVMNARVIKNQLFVLTENGIFIYTNGMSRKPIHWFEGISVMDIFSDGQGNSWICTRGKGIRFVPAGRHDLVFPGSLLSIETGPNNTFFGGLLDGTIARIDRRGKILQRYENSASREALFLHYDGLGKLLYSSNGVYSIFTGSALNVINEGIKSVARSANGGIYLAKSSGVVYIRPDKKQLPAYALTDSSKFQVLRFEPGRSVLYNEQTDETAISTVKGVFIRKGDGELKEIKYATGAIDAQSIAWFNNKLVIATSSNDILQFNNGTVVQRLDLSENLGDLIILKMLATKTHVYLLTEKGMYRFTDIAAKLESLKELVGFDGLVMRDFTIMDDYLYIATQRGVLRFIWKDEPRISFSLVLSDIYGRKYRKNKIRNGRIIFPADEETIVLPFECVDLTGNQQFIIQYAIRTGDEKRIWNSLPSSVNQLNLSHLGPGKYRVDFRLLEPLSKTVSVMQTKEFTLLGHWYNRPVLWWLLGLAAAFFIGYFWRLSLIRQRKTILKKVRTRSRRSVN